MSGGARREREALRLTQLDRLNGVPQEERVYLSAPLVGDREIELVSEALRSRWAAPVGPDLAAFEAGIAEFTKIPMPSTVRQR